MKNIGIIAAIITFVVVVFVVGSFISAKNVGNAEENRIHAMYTNNQNVFAQFGQKVAEELGVVEMQVDDAKSLYATVLEARYGSAGLKTQIAMIQEAMPGLDTSVYQSLQRVIEAGRNDFQFAQTQLVDAKRSYRTMLGSPIKGMFLDMAGFPRIDIGYPLGTKDDYPIITSTRAAKTFSTGVECGNALSAAKGTDNCE